MIFRDDECRVRTDNAPFNLAIVKHIALNVLRTGKSKDSLRMRRKVRIPRQSGRGFRFDVGRRSDLIPATIPK